MRARIAAVEARAALNRTLRKYFEDRGFTEVETPHLVRAAGTDPYIDPVPSTVQLDGTVRQLWLHTSPEFAMKGLLADGMTRIYQLCHVWRDGEQTPLHSPEFTILEWYRAHEGYDVIMDDVEAIACAVLPVDLSVRISGYGAQLDLRTPFRRVTMQDAWLEACGIDPIATAGDRLALAEAAGIEPRWDRWDELFFDLMLERVEPWMKRQGALFVTEWPVELAVLARKCAHDERVAERFELYVGGVELANGFGELTDPVEQRARFEADNVERTALGKQIQPIPEDLLESLRRGLPASAGVAVGVDRLLMLSMGAQTIDEVVTKI